MAVVGSEVARVIVTEDEVREDVAGLVVKVGAVVSEMVRVKVVVLVVPPPMAVMVMVLTPVGVEAEVFMVRVEEQLGLQVMGEKLEVTPEGRPVTEKLREAGVPVVRVAVIVDCPELP